MNQEIFEEIKSFAGIYFNFVVDKINKVTGSNLKFELPKLYLARTRTESEQNEFLGLESSFYDIDSRVKKLGMSPIETKKKILSDFGEERQKRFIFLKHHTLLEDKLGAASDSGDTLILNPSYFEDKIEYETIGHEILHCIRNQITPKSISDPLSLELEEFYPNLYRVIIPSLPDSYEYIKQLPYKANLELRLRCGHKFFYKSGKMGIKKRFREFAVLFNNVMQLSGKIITPKELIAVKKYISVYKNISRYDLYIRLISGIPQGSFEDLMDYTKQLHSIFSNRRSSDDLEHPNLIEIQDRLSHYFNNDSLNADISHLISTLAVDLNYKELRKNWPLILVSDSKLVDEKYVKPTRKLLNRYANT